MSESEKSQNQVYDVVIIGAGEQTFSLLKVFYLS